MIEKKSILIFGDNVYSDINKILIEEINKFSNVNGINVDISQLSKNSNNTVKKYLGSKNKKLKDYLQNADEVKTYKDIDKIPKYNGKYNKNSSFHRHTVNAISRFSPEIVIVTDYKLVGVVAMAIEYNLCKCKLIAVLPDLILDKRFINPKINSYYVDNREMKEQLLSSGVAEKNIRVNSLPIAKNMITTLDKEESEQSLRLANKNRVLILTSKNGNNSDIYDLTKYIKWTKPELDVIVFCQNDESLATDIKTLEVVVFTNESILGKVIDSADLVICKPTSENMRHCLAKRKDIITYSPNNILEERIMSYLGKENTLTATTQFEVANYVEGYFAYLDAQTIKNRLLSSDEDEVSEDEYNFTARISDYEKVTQSTNPMSNLRAVRNNNLNSAKSIVEEIITGKQIY